MHLILDIYYSTEHDSTTTTVRWCSSNEQPSVFSDVTPDMSPNGMASTSLDTMTQATSGERLSQSYGMSDVTTLQALLAPKTPQPQLYSSIDPTEGSSPGAPNALYMYPVFANEPQSYRVSAPEVTSDGIMMSMNGEVTTQQPYRTSTTDVTSERYIPHNGVAQSYRISEQHATNAGLLSPLSTTRSCNDMSPISRTSSGHDVPSSHSISPAVNSPPALTPSAALYAGTMSRTMTSLLEDTYANGDCHSSDIGHEVNMMTSDLVALWPFSSPLTGVRDLRLCAIYVYVCCGICVQEYGALRNYHALRWVWGAWVFYYTQMAFVWSHDKLINLNG